MEWLIIVFAIAAYAIYRAWPRSEQNDDAPEPLVLVPNENNLRKSHEVRRQADYPDLPDSDAWETDLLIGTDGAIPVKIDAQIQYVDGNQQPSRRKITTRTLVPWNEQFAILAYCHDRHAQRTFLVNRIKEFVDLSSGEVVSDVVRHLKSIHDRSPHGQVAGAFAKHESELTVLLFVARANSSLSAKDRRLILNYIQEQNSEIEAPDNLWAASIPPDTASLRSFRAAVRGLASLDVKQNSRLLATINAMAPKGINALTKAAAETAIQVLARS